MSVHVPRFSSLDFLPMVGLVCIGLFRSFSSGDGGSGNIIVTFRVRRKNDDYIRSIVRRYVDVPVVLFRLVCTGII